MSALDLYDNDHMISSPKSSDDLKHQLWLQRRMNRSLDESLEKLCEQPSSSSTSSSSTTSYSPHYQRFNYNQNRQHHNLNNRYSTPSKLNYRMKQTYRSTCDLLS